jgi:hypothetical protein
MKRHQGIILALSLIILLGFGLFVLSGLFHPGFFVSDDGGWMIIRLSAFFQSFREGQFPVRFLGRLNYSYGYPVANFLYPGFLYIGSLIHVIGFSFINSVKIIFGLSVLAGAYFTFLWLKQYFRAVESAVGALCFVSAPYLLFDLYTRGSVGEILALAWAAMGLYSIAAKKPWLLSLAVSLLIVSHNSLAVLFLGFYVVYITVLGRWREFWLMFVLGIGMVMFFWFPALYERKYVVFDAVQVANPAAYFVTSRSVMLLGFSGIAAGCIALFIRKSLRKEKIFFVLSFVLTLFMVLPVSSFIWRSSLLVHIIQFPYRFLSLTVLIGCWLVAYVLNFLRTLFRFPLIVLCIAFSLWSSVLSLQKIQYTNLPDGYYTTNEATTTVQNEYMPRWASQLPTQHAYQKLIFYQGAGTFEIKKISTQSLDVVIHATQDSIVQINTLYYPGWGVSLDDAAVHIDYKNPQGLMRVAVPQGTHRLVAGFRETISRFLADNISLGFLIWYGIAVFVRRRRT